MQLRINTCGLHDCTPGWNWITQENGFPDYDIWAVFRGKGTLTPQTSLHPEYPLREGTALLLAPNVQYAARHDPEHPLFVINVHFDFLDERGAVSFPRPITAKRVGNPDFLKTLLLRCVTLFHSNRPDEAATFLAAALAEYDISEELTDRNAEGQWQRMVYEMIGEIDLSQKPPTLAQFARHYGYSERYLGKMFAKVSGVSFSEYVGNTRISKAKLLLRNTSLPMAKIAEETGFCDACHFAKVFHQSVGTSPLAYRKNL